MTRVFVKGVACSEKTQIITPVYSSSQLYRASFSSLLWFTITTLSVISTNQFNQFLMNKL